MAIEANRVALVLLAAGLGRRFGGAKLSADLNGRPLGLHAAQTLAAAGFARRIAVTAQDGPDFAGLEFEVVENDRPEAGQAHSLALGVMAVGTDLPCLIALADMPFVTAAHIAALLEAFDGDRVASTVDGTPMPPALFGADYRARLGSLAGDRGARGLLRGARLVTADARCLADIDRPEDLLSHSAR